MEKQRTRDRAPGECGCVRAEKDPGGEKHSERKKRCALQAKGGERVWRCGPGQPRSAQEGAKAPTKTPTRLRDEGPTAAGGRGKGGGQAVEGLAAEGCG